MKNIVICLSVISITLFVGCASKEEKLLKLQQEHEFNMKKLEIRQNQTAEEKLLDDVSEGAKKWLFWN